MIISIYPKFPNILFKKTLKQIASKGERERERERGGESKKEKRREENGRAFSTD